MAFLFFFVLNKSTMQSELLCRLTPSSTPVSSDISKLVNMYVDAAPLVSTFLWDFFSREGAIFKNGITERSAASCWNLQSLIYISMDLSISEICCLRHTSSS